jgi:hypothetical protein
MAEAFVHRATKSDGQRGLAHRSGEVATDGTALASWLEEHAAKQGWDLPNDKQLEVYAQRVTSAGTGALVTLSQASVEWAAKKLPSTVLDVPVRHLPWSQVRQLLTTARPGSRGAERLCLDELDSYPRRASQGGWAREWAHRRQFAAIRILSRQPATAS